MGIYLGQLPPAEIARFKAELAETISANFCYPRFFDYRTESLQTRPIDRTKRQEVWLYLSSVDFTAWSRVDLTSADFPHHIERLFIQFVQRNRSFFGAQGRRRMLDIRLSIGTCAGAVAQRLRSHLTGQPITPLFGSPRPVLSWTATPISGRPEPAWEQITASTIELQRQLQEWRGEARTSAGMEEQVAATVAPTSRTSQNDRPGVADALTSVQTSVSATNGQGPRPSRPQQVPVSPVNPLNPAASFDHSIVAAQQPTMPTPPITTHPYQPQAQPGQYNRGSVAPAPNPVAASAAPVAPVTPNVLKTTVPNPSGALPVPPAASRRLSGNLNQAVEQNVAARQSGRGMHFRVATSPTAAMTAASPERPPVQAVPSVEQLQASASLSSTSVNGPGQREIFVVGEDDVAIFEQMRHQLVLWLRIEAVSAGLEVGGQGPTQLLEMLRQQGRYDETRLQIVSTLLNLAGQVMKTGTVSVLDYKQALTFHLMHTRRA